METLLYFEECECNLSKTLFSRIDIDFVILRTTKNMKYFSREYLEETEKYDVYVLDYYGNMEDEARKFNDWCRERNITITKFLNDSEYYLEYTNKFARLLGLETLTDEQINWVRDKVYMKDRFNRIGLDTVDYRNVESKKDVLIFFLEHDMKRIVFKPRCGMNSIDTYMIDTLEDIENLNITFKPGKYMVETFCYDHEWSIESVVQNGIVLDSYVTYIPNATIWASIANDLNCHMTVPKVPEYFKFVPRDFIQTIVTGMELKNGVMTIEVFIDDNGNIKPSELGWRLPGCQATTNHSLSYGIDLYNILLDISIGKKVELSYHFPIVSVGDLYLPNKTGFVTRITSIEELMNYEGVVDLEMFAKLGEYQEKRRVGNDASGWVQVVGSDEFETLERMRNIFNNFIIETVCDKEGVKKRVKKN